MGDDVLRNLLSLEFLLEVVLDHMQKIDSSARELELREQLRLSQEQDVVVAAIVYVNDVWLSVTFSQQSFQLPSSDDANSSRHGFLYRIHDTPAQSVARILLDEFRINVFVVDKYERELKSLKRKHRNKPLL